MPRVGVRNERQPWVSATTHLNPKGVAQGDASVSILVENAILPLQLPFLGLTENLFLL
jgi:hypothetical protein